MPNHPMTFQKVCMLRTRKEKCNELFEYLHTFPCYRVVVHLHSLSLPTVLLLLLPFLLFLLLRCLSDELVWLANWRPDQLIATRSSWHKQSLTSGATRSEKLIKKQKSCCLLRLEVSVGSDCLMCPCRLHQSATRVSGAHVVQQSPQLIQCRPSSVRS